MPRRPKPYEYRGWYVTSYGGHAHQRLVPVEAGLKQAEIALAKVIVETEQRRKTEAVREATGHVTVAQAIEDLLQWKATEVRDVTARGYEYQLNYFMKWLDAQDRKLGRNRLVSSIIERDGIAYKRHLLKEQKLAAASANRFIVAVKILLNWVSKRARRNKYGVTENPWTEIKLARERQRERIATDEEFQVLLDNTSKERFRDMLLVLRHTTMRPWELRRLKWEHIHWNTHQIVLPADDVKTKSRRPMTMLPIVEEVLARRLAEARGLTTITPAGYVFPGAGAAGNGTRYDPSVPLANHTFSPWFSLLISRCAQRGLIQQIKNGEPLTPRSLRHTRITEMCRQNLPINVVMTEAGHTNPKTTMRYVHLGGEIAQMVRDKARQASVG